MLANLVDYLQSLFDQVHLWASGSPFWSGLFTLGWGLVKVALIIGFRSGSSGR